jgi:hypothetical protein
MQGNDQITRRQDWLKSGILFVVTIMLTCLTLLLVEGRRLHGESGSEPAWVDHPNAAAVQPPTVLTKHQLFSEDHAADVIAVQEVWAAYVFYNDSINGPAVASLFTPDGVDQHLWADGQGKLIPHFGIVAAGDEGKNITPMGPKGSGCVLHGREQIAYYFGDKRAAAPTGWPGHGHHETPSILVKVSDDGQTALMSAPAVLVGVNDKGQGRVGSGGYRAFFKKTNEGWEIAELYAINDRPVISPGCDVNGPTGMRK